MQQLLRNRDMRWGRIVRSQWHAAVALAMGIGYWCGRSAGSLPVSLDLNRVSDGSERYEHGGSDRSC